jgi:hypothetical protein
MTTGLAPPRGPGLYEPQTLVEVAAMHFGVFSIFNPNSFHETVSSNFMAHVLDRLFDKFRADPRVESFKHKVTALVFLINNTNISIILIRVPKNSLRAAMLIMSRDLILSLGLKLREEI